MAQVKKEKGKIRYAEVLRKFVHPTVQESDGLAEIQQKYAFGVHVWNAEAIRNKNPELYDSAKQQVIEKATDPQEATELFDQMLKFKQEEFSAFKKVIIDFEIMGKSAADYTVTVASAELKK